MIDGLKPYSDYKDSGVPRLGNVPEHWGVRRIRNAAEMRVSNVDKHTKDEEHPVRLCNYVDVYKNDRINDSITFMRATATTEEIERFRIQVGDVLITKDSEAWNDIGVPALVEQSADDLICGYHLALLRPRDGLLRGGYLFRVLQSKPVAYQFHVEANGVTRHGLSHSAIKSIWLPCPPLAEQESIVRFLDHADRLIRRYIRAKKKLIALLNEQKQAIIHQAVTRGLDPNVKLKPSGVDWLGDIPEHWEIRRLRTLVRHIDQGVSPQAEAQLSDEKTWGVLKAGCVNHGTFRPTEHKRLPVNFEIDTNIVIKTGDVLVSRACGSPHLVGSVARVTPNNYNLILSDKTFRLIFKEPDLVDFLVTAMNAPYYRRQVRLAISGAEGLANNLPLSSLRDFLFFVPPPNEALRIHEALSKDLNQIQQTLEKAEREIVLLQEFRTRLIADTVTGKLDVREAAARLPDEAEVSETIDELDEAIEDGDLLDDPDLEEAAMEAGA